MDWTPEPSSDRLSLTMGTCVATAWPSIRHGYAAKVMFRGMATAQYGFTTLEDAQAWCLATIKDVRFPKELVKIHALNVHLSHGFGRGMNTLAKRNNPDAHPNSS